MSIVSGNQGADIAALIELSEMRDEPLDEELAAYLEEGSFGPMIRHPLVYEMVVINGMANKHLRYKQEALAKAEAAQDWDTCVWLHERPYRLRALIDYCTGRNDDWEIIPLREVPKEHWDLALSVWVDSENIMQRLADWRALFDNGEGIWLGDREEFDALPTIDHKDGPMIHAWRGGSVGDWSWTTNLKVAEFFSNRSGLPVRGCQIPVSDVFGFTNQRSESELFVRFTEFRRALVYPGNEDREGD